MIRSIISVGTIFIFIIILFYVLLNPQMVMPMVKSGFKLMFEAVTKFISSI
jgi:hypothetical protein